MSAILMDWVNRELRLSRAVSNIDADFSNGFLFGEILFRFNQQKDFTYHFVDKDTVSSKIDNFCCLEPTFAALQMKVTATTATAVMNETPGAAAQLLYKLKMALGRVAGAGVTGKQRTQYGGYQLTEGVIPLNNLSHRSPRRAYDEATHIQTEQSMHARGQNQTEVNMVAHLSRFEVERLRQDAKVEEAKERDRAAQARMVDSIRQSTNEVIAARRDVLQPQPVVHGTGGDVWAAHMDRQQTARASASRRTASRSMTASMKRTARKELVDTTTRNELERFEANLRATVSVRREQYHAAPVDQPEDAPARTDALLARPGRTLAVEPEDRTLRARDAEQQMAQMRRRRAQREKRTKSRAQRRQKFVSTELGWLTEHANAVASEAVLHAQLLHRSLAEQKLDTQLARVEKIKKVTIINRRFRQEQLQARREIDAKAIVGDEVLRLATMKDEYTARVALKTQQASEHSAALRWTCDRAVAADCRAIVLRAVDLALLVSAERSARLGLAVAGRPTPLSIWEAKTGLGMPFHRRAELGSVFTSLPATPMEAMASPSAGGGDDGFAALFAEAQLALDVRERVAYLAAPTSAEWPIAPNAALGTLVHAVRDKATPPPRPLRPDGELYGAIRGKLLVAIVGPPTCGQSAQAALLAEHFGLVVVTPTPPPAAAEGEIALDAAPGGEGEGDGAAADDAVPETKEEGSVAADGDEACDDAAAEADDETAVVVPWYDELAASVASPIDDQGEPIYVKDLDQRMVNEVVRQIKASIASAAPTPAEAEEAEAEAEAPAEVAVVEGVAEAKAAEEDAAPAPEAEADAGGEPAAEASAKPAVAEAEASLPEAEVEAESAGVAGWVLDGFPRTVRQAWLLECALCGYSTEPGAPRYFPIDRAAAAQKAVAATTTPSNAVLAPPPTSEVMAPQLPPSALTTLVRLEMSDGDVLARVLGVRDDPDTGVRYHVATNPPAPQIMLAKKLASVGESPRAAAIGDELSEWNAATGDLEAWLRPAGLLSPVPVGEERCAADVAQLVAAAVEAANVPPPSDVVVVPPGAAQIDLDIYGDIVVTLSSQWSCLERNVCAELEALFHELRAASLRSSFHLGSVRSAFMAVLTRPDVHAELIRSFTAEFDALPEPLRWSAATKDELSLRTTTLVEALWDATEAREAKCAATLDRLLDGRAAGADGEAEAAAAAPAPAAKGKKGKKGKDAAAAPADADVAESAPKATWLSAERDAIATRYACLVQTELQRWHATQRFALDLFTSRTAILTSVEAEAGAAIVELDDRVAAETAAAVEAAAVAAVAATAAEEGLEGAEDGNETRPSTPAPAPSPVPEPTEEEAAAATAEKVAATAATQRALCSGLSSFYPIVVDALPSFTPAAEKVTALVASAQPAAKEEDAAAGGKGAKGKVAKGKSDPEVAVADAAPTGDAAQRAVGGALAIAQAAQARFAAGAATGDALSTVLWAEANLFVARLERLGGACAAAQAVVTSEFTATREELTAWATAWSDRQLAAAMSFAAAARAATEASTPLGRTYTLRGDVLEVSARAAVNGEAATVAAKNAVLQRGGFALRESVFAPAQLRGVAAALRGVASRGGGTVPVRVATEALRRLASSAPGAVPPLLALYDSATWLRLVRNVAAQGDTAAAASDLVEWRALFIALFAMSTAAGSAAPILDAATLDVLAAAVAPAPAQALADAGATEAEGAAKASAEEGAAEEGAAEAAAEESAAPAAPRGVTVDAWMGAVDHFGPPIDHTSRPLERADSDALFKRMDANSDGVLNLIELSKGLDEMISGAADFLPEGDIRIGARRFWKLADADGDKLLSADEFHAMLVRVIGRQGGAVEAAAHRLGLMKAVLFDSLLEAGERTIPYAVVAAHVSVVPPHWGEVAQSHAAFYEGAVEGVSELIGLACGGEIEVEEEEEHTYSHHANAVVGDSELVDSTDHTHVDGESDAAATAAEDA